MDKKRELWESKKKAASKAKQKVKEKNEVRATSSFSSPTPSRASVETMVIRANKGKGPAPIFWSYILGMVGLYGLIVLDGLQSAYTLVYAVLLSGLWAILRPPEKGASRVLDWFALALLVLPVLSLVPQFYWPAAGWRESLSVVSGISLPSSLAIQPWFSIEIWVQFVAGLIWFYVALSWPLNFTGRKWIYMGFSVLLSLVGFAILWGFSGDGMMIGPFRVIQDEAFNSAFLASGAVLCFASMLANLQGRDLVPFSGLIGMGVALGALYGSGSGFGLALFLVGVSIWYVLKVRSGDLSRFLAVFIPLIVLGLGLLILKSSTLDIRPSGVFENVEGESSSRSGSALEMFLDAPISGVGLGNFETILPQYERVVSEFESVVRPGSDILLFGVEAGVFGLVAIGGFVVAYLFLFRVKKGRNAGKMRGPARLALAVFALAVLLDTPAHNLGAIYYAIFLMVLALPRLNLKQQFVFPSFAWRVSGGLLVATGLVWAVAVPLSLPLTNSIAEKRFAADFEEAADDEAFSKMLQLMEEWTSKNPLDAEVYEKKAQWILEQGGSVFDAESSFAKAYASDPFRAEIPLRAGVALAAHDIDRALDAWSLALNVGLIDAERGVATMVDTSRENPRLRRRLGELPEEHGSYLALFLRKMEGSELRREVEKQLSRDPGLKSFSREERTAVVMNWVNQGGGSSVEAFLDSYPDTIDREWLARSVIAKDRADFAGAVELIRSNVERPALPGEVLRVDHLIRVQREYAVNRQDIAKGGSLLRYYVENEEYLSASRIAEQLSEAPDAPLSVLYWKAETQFKLEDYIESWFTFQRYLDRAGFQKE